MDAGPIELLDCRRERAIGPATNPHLVGHERVEALVLEAWRHGRLPHAWLLDRPQAVSARPRSPSASRGATSPAIRRRTLPTIRRMPVFRQIASGAHPDFHLLQPRSRGSRRGQRGEEKVDAVREQIAALHRTSAGGGGRRVLLVDEAEATLNMYGFNALLKLLEEPPRRPALSRWSRPGPAPCPPPSASRCARLRLAPLGVALVERALGLVAPELEEPAPASSRRRGGRQRRPGAPSSRERLARQLCRPDPGAGGSAPIACGPARGGRASAARGPEPGDRHGGRAGGPARAPCGAGCRRLEAGPRPRRGRGRSASPPWPRARALIA